MTGAAGSALTGSAAASFLGAAAAAPALASVSISRNCAPTSTVSPSSEKYYLMTPECVERISTVTLSVSMRATISSASTNSPTSIQQSCKFKKELTFDEFFNDSLRDGVSHGGDWLNGYERNRMLMFICLDLIYGYAPVTYYLRTLW